MMTREEVLKAAAECVLKDRANTYGPPEDSFSIIAELWSAYFGLDMTSVDVAAMMILLKLARIRKSPDHADSWVDIAGYAACGGEIGTKESETK